VTPLTRRAFSGGHVIQNLANETAKGIAVANSTGCRIIDLNKASTAYVNAIGATVSAKSD
jgi:CheY-specific phosphatase CheX